MEMVTAPRRLSLFLLAICVISTSVAEEDGFIDFLNWARERGAGFEASLTVGEDSKTGLRGLLAGSALPKGAELISVPKDLLLTDSVVQSETNPAWQQCCAGRDSVRGKIHTAFALFILQQRKEGSDWYPWASALPDAFDEFPLFYSPEELDGFQRSPVRRVIELDQESVDADFSTISRAMPGLTIEEFRWARCAVKSRVFGLKSLSKNRLSQEVIAMVPLADFVNHAPDGVVVNVSPEYDVGSGKFSFVTTRDIQAGEGIYWDYGFKSNRASLLRYGFTSMSRVPRTDLPFFWKLTDFPEEGQPYKASKLAQIEAAKRAGALAIDPDGTVLHELSLTVTGKDAEKLLGHMRFSVLDTDNETVLGGCCGDTYCQPISADNEKRALAHLIAVVQRLLDSYPTSANEDKAIIDSGKLSFSDGAQWHTLVVRYGEKKILFGITRMIGALASLFDLSPDDFQKQVKERWNNPDSDIHRYVLTTVTELRAGKVCDGSNYVAGSLPTASTAVAAVGILVVVVAGLGSFQSTKAKKAEKAEKDS
eukprot:TRINITY_DN14776_c0_g1_i1.p1 TRINITY_DN14776_c0_g1~~TRINITY_DN14776_c0_g1_i1.p1  ORF type:complete len:537 (+),score=98.79 TRINITY_DN14776_c0_g1_i1:49-1659(+)